MKKNDPLTKSIILAEAMLLNKAWQRKDGSWWERDPKTDKIVPYRAKEKGSPEGKENKASISSPKKFDEFMGKHYFQGLQDKVEKDGSMDKVWNVADYSTDEYCQRVTDHLIRGSQVGKKTQEVINDMSDYIKETPLVADMDLFRGMNGVDFKVGQVLRKTEVWTRFGT